VSFVLRVVLQRFSWFPFNEFPCMAVRRTAVSGRSSEHLSPMICLKVRLFTSSAARAFVLPFLALILSPAVDRGPE
jgi:hypothetical protein